MSRTVLERIQDKLDLIERLVYDIRYEELEAVKKELFEAQEEALNVAPNLA